jgi:hypothetical protein
MKQNCETCRYFEKVGINEKGYCHRYPPKPFAIFDTERTGIEVSLTDFCGEYKKRSQRSENNK